MSIPPEEVTPSSTTPITHPAPNKVDNETIKITLLLVSGKRSDLVVSPSDTVEAIKRRIFENWPKEWSEELPESPAQLRLLLRGKFLEPNSTMEGNKIPTGQTTTVHLIIKSAASSEGTAEKAKNLDHAGSCRCTIM
ncbi:hypothetical protein SmJEL517_g03196 [Synchytrium microbalum]|uniref:Ubiquitin-like domain-containing protein n=1 Tax=Synchytrium microbalum TaxID=1806994 RepID=A0A507C8Z2_9FUNG|nr:uncharacterized protein SmJEL517_g03196 [Synchytrium microbalum]TPX33975.1 hypothetical protein SmJEL517_g03196 [Synchytrium microbalum]